MTDKVCQLYEEEQRGKITEGRKAIPTSKMPDLGWDVTEEIETQDKRCNTTLEREKTQEIEETEITVPVVPQTIIAIAIIILTLLETIKAHIQEIPDI